MSDFFAFEVNYETGDFTQWGSEVDTESKLSVDHFKLVTEQLGRYPLALPYRGAYCAHIDLSVGTADAYVQDTTALVGAATVTLWTRFYFQVLSNLVMAASDYFTIYTLQSAAAGGTDEAVIGVVRTAGGVYQLVAGETSTLAAAQGAKTVSADLSFDMWHCVEMRVVVDAGGGNDGTIQLFLDGYQVGANITALDQAAVTQGRLGAIGIDAGTTRGHLLFDCFAAHSARIGPLEPRYTQTVEVTKSGFIAVGPGRVMQYALEPGAAADGFMNIYDLDRVPLLLSAKRIGPTLANGVASETRSYEFPSDGVLAGYFNRGCYVTLSGTTPRATVTFGEALVSVGAIKQYAVMSKLVP